MHERLLIIHDKPTLKPVFEGFIWEKMNTKAELRKHMWTHKPFFPVKYQSLAAWDAELQTEGSSALEVVCDNPPQIQQVIQQWSIFIQPWVA